MTQQELAFVNHVKKECRSRKVKFDLRKRSGYLRLSGNIKCSGYFDGDFKELVVAAKRKDWVEILVHEYGHLTQWAEQCKEWVACGGTIDHVERWLSGERVKHVFNHIRSLRDLELDNEKRSVELIKRFDLPVDTKRYIKKANGYVYFYTWMMKTRRWSGLDNSPYSNENIISAMPEEFQENYENVPDYVAKVFKEEGL